MQELDLDRSDYYAILGISRNASVDEIKQQYRTLSRQFHPDKQAPELQEYANEYFHRIDRAYQVLSDEKKRKMYDLYGEKAVQIVEQNAELIQRNDSIDTLEDLVHTLYERELEVKSGQSGSFTLSVDVTSLIKGLGVTHSFGSENATHSLGGGNANPLLERNIPGTPMMSSFMMQPPPKPKKVYISSIQIVQSIQTRVSASDVISLTGTATAQDGRGMGVAVIGFQHTLSPEQMITLSMLCGARNRVVCEVVQSLTHDLQGMVGLSYGDDGFETEMKIAKQFKENLVGSLNVALEKTVECSIDTEYRTPLSKLSTSLFVGHDLGASVNYLRTLHSELGIKGKIDCKVSLGDLCVETMLGKELSPFSKVNMNVVVGLSQVSLKFKYQRGNMNFILPILLGKNLLDVKSVLIAYGVSGLVTLLSALYYRSFKGKQRQTQKQEEEKKKQFLKEHKRLAALSQQQMMKSIAEKKKHVEEEKQGLVILQAVYGDAEAIRVPSKVKQMEDGIDVTIPLQFMTDNSKLRLYAGSKKEYMGFWKSSEKCRLYVRYCFNEKVYEVEVEDDEPLYLPTFRANCMGDAKDVC